MMSTRFTLVAGLAAVLGLGCEGSMERPSETGVPIVPTAEGGQPTGARCVTPSDDDGDEDGDDAEDDDVDGTSEVRNPDGCEPGAGNTSDDDGDGGSEDTGDRDDEDDGLFDG